MSRFFIGDTDSSSNSSDESFEFESPVAYRPFHHNPGLNTGVDQQVVRGVKSVAVKRQNELKESLDLMASSQSWVHVQRGKRHANGRRVSQNELTLAQQKVNSFIPSHLKVVCAAANPARNLLFQQRLLVRTRFSRR